MLASCWRWHKETYFANLQICLLPLLLAIDIRTNAKTKQSLHSYAILSSNLGVKKETNEEVPQKCVPQKELRLTSKVLIDCDVYIAYFCVNGNCNGGGMWFRVILQDRVQFLQKGKTISTKVSMFVVSPCNECKVWCSLLTSKV